MAIHELTTSWKLAMTVARADVGEMHKRFASH